MGNSRSSEGERIKLKDAPGWAGHADGYNSHTEERCLFDKSPYQDANILHRISFSWIHQVMRTAFQRPLVDADIHPVVNNMRAQYNSESFERYWQQVGEGRKKKKGSLAWSLIYHFKSPLLLGTLLLIVMMIGQFYLIILSKIIVGQLDLGQGFESRSTWLIFGSMAILQTAVIICNSQGCQVVSMVEARMKSTLIAMIYKKVLSVSSKERRKMMSGRSINLIGTEVEKLNVMLQGNCYAIAGLVLLLLYIIHAAIDFGVSILPSLFILILFFVSQYVLSDYVAAQSYKQGAETESRVSLMDEIIRSIRLIKIYCWEGKFAEKQQDLRSVELKTQRVRTILSAILQAATVPFGKCFVFVTVITHFLRGETITGKETLALIGMVRIMYFNLFQTVTVSQILLKEFVRGTDRIKEFLALSEDAALPLQDVRACVEIYQLSASWNQLSEVENGFMLRDITLKARQGQFFGVVGKVGAGKTSLLNACMDELYVHTGSVHVTGRIAYLPQEPWILSRSVRGNITMATQYDARRYRNILHACCLELDLSRMPEGDNTLIGERGLTLSGGQKARIALARAVYQDADIYLLDDPLSAVDARVGNDIFSRCILGLLKDKTRILVTHHMEYLQHMDNILLLHEGKLIVSGAHEETKHTVNEYIEEKDRTKADPILYDKVIAGENPYNQAFVSMVDKERIEPKLMKEKNESGSVGLWVYWTYLKQGKFLQGLPAIFIFLSIGVASGICFDWIIANWGRRKSYNNNHISGNSTTEWSPFTSILVNKDDHWFLQYSGLLLPGLAVADILTMVCVAVILGTAGRNLYNAMFSRLLTAPSHFFDTNPVGQVLNRFSRDTTNMDSTLAFRLLRATVIILLMCLPDVVYVCILSPYTLIPLPLLILVIYGVLTVFLPGIRETKRLEASRASNIFSHLSTTIDGLPVIRTMGLQEDFLQQAYAYLDINTSAYFLFTSAQRTLGFYIANLCSLANSIIMFILIYNYQDGGGVTSTSTGLAMIYFIGLLDNAQTMTFYASDVEVCMTSVERIQQYSHLEQEAAGHVTGLPPPGWPQEGAIDVYNLQLTYRGQHLPALGPVSFSVRPREKIGIVGRTGAGKSSLLVSLLRMEEPRGTVLIDGLPIHTLGLTDLRSAISVIPQDPILFQGSLRYNLDPFSEYSDNQLWAALENVELKEKVLSLPEGWMTDAGKDGSSLSVGEKQLFCVARAILKQSKIVLVDEATSNVDNRTDISLWRVLYSSLSNATVLTISHRLRTVMGSDKILVLDGGKIVEFDSPIQLLQDDKSHFYRMISLHGEDFLQTFTKQVISKQT